MSNDLSIECLIAPRMPKVSADPTVREQSMYRSLMSELSTVMAVPIAEPADTTGYSGFHFSFDINATSISSNNAYWSGYPQNGGGRALAGVRHVSGQFLPVASIMLRKGVWFLPLPLFPSLEVGFGASNLLQSGIYGLNGYVKFAIHEGYHDIPIPSFAVRASVARISGTAQVDMTVLTVEGIISKAFGAGGTMTFEPYLGGGALFSIVRSQVIDTAPAVDLYREGGPMPGNVNFGVEALSQKIVFPTQDDIIRWRIFAGLNMHFAIVSITAWFTYWGAGADNSVDVNTLPNTPGPGVNTTNVKPADLSFSQFSVGGNVGLRF